MMSEQAVELIAVGNQCVETWKRDLDQKLLIYINDLIFGDVRYI